MSRIITSFILFFFLLCSCSFKAEGKGDRGKAVIALSDSIVDFGTIPMDSGMASRSVEVTNTGKGLLVIGKLETSCHCAQASYDKKPVKAGCKSRITVTLNPDEMFPGYFERTITVHSNATQPFKCLQVRGVIRKNKN